MKITVRKGDTEIIVDGGSKDSNLTDSDHRVNRITKIVTHITKELLSLTTQP